MSGRTTILSRSGKPYLCRRQKSVALRRQESIAAVTVDNTIEEHHCMEAYKQILMTKFSRTHQTSQFLRAWRAQIATNQLASAGRHSLCSLAALVAIVCLSFSFSATNLHAQGYGTISGTVNDPSGAVIPGANVVATEVRTGTAMTTTSGKRWPICVSDSSACRLFALGHCRGIRALLAEGHCSWGQPGPHLEYHAEGRSANANRQRLSRRAAG